MRHGDLSLKITLSHEGQSPKYDYVIECDKSHVTTFLQQLICYHSAVENLGMVHRNLSLCHVTMINSSH